MTAPLTELTKLSDRIKWTGEHTKAWRALQQAMSTYPILRQPDSRKEYFVDTDASNVGLGAALMQRGDDGTPHPVAYASRKLTPVEQTYSTREQEALAIVFAVDKFDCYLAGRRFTVVTDHRSLSWLMTQPMVKGRLANWAYKLRNYDFNIIYRKGSENHLADFLSRAVGTAQALMVGAHSVEWAAREAERMVVVEEAMTTVDRGVPRLARPARNILKGEPAGRDRLTLPAHPVMTTSILLAGEGEGFAGALPCLEGESKEERKLEVKEEKTGENG